MLAKLYVVSVGSRESSDLIRDLLLVRTRCQLFVAADAEGLSAILASGRLDVAILHNTLSAAEMRSCSVYIRHHWPSAQILLLREDADVLDDPMYDERIAPDSSSKELLAIIERLAVCARRGNHGMLSQRRTRS